MSSIDDIKHQEAVALAHLTSPTPADPTPAPNNTGTGTAAPGDPYAGRYPTGTDPRVRSLRPAGER